MAGIRSLAIAFVVGGGAALYLILAVRVPNHLAVIVGAAMTLVILLVTTVVSDDDEAAEAAWRAAAPDLDDRQAPPSLDAIRPAAERDGGRGGDDAGDRSGRGR